MSKGIKDKKIKPRKTLLRIGDPVIVLSGSKGEGRLNKGDKGTLKSFFGAERDRVIVEGLNKVTKHKRAASMNEKSERIEKEAPFAISRVAYYVESLKKAVKLKTQVGDNGKKVRGYIHPENKKFVSLEK